MASGMGRKRERPAPSLSRASVFLVGDCDWLALFSVNLAGLECAMFLADLLGRQMAVAEVYNRYELLMYKQWLRVYMRSKIIKHNKDIFERLDDTFGILERLHIY
jgi:hypothetical protein